MTWSSSSRSVLHLPLTFSYLCTNISLITLFSYTPILYSTKSNNCTIYQRCPRNAHLWQNLLLLYSFVIDLPEDGRTEAEAYRGTLLLFSTYALQPSRRIVRSGLDVPTFATRRLHAAEGKTMGEKYSEILPKCRFTRYIWGSFKCRKATTWDRRLYFPLEGSRADDF
jgi:hypothetical protein